MVPDPKGRGYPPRPDSTTIERRTNALVRSVHIEIPADDTATGPRVLGLAVRLGVPVVPGPSEYHMAGSASKSGVAITNMEPGKRGTRAYFDVDDINVEAARVQELGGEAGEAMPVPDMGWFATCSDPHGNEFGLWQSDENATVPTE